MLSKKNIALTAIATVATVFLATSASAAPSGSYFGLQLGAGKINPGKGLQTGAVNAFNSLNVNSSTKFAGRVFGGYQFTPTFAGELGYTQFGNTSKTTTTAALSATNHVNIRTYAVDLVGKATLPLQNGLSLYGKAGAAYLNQQGKSYSTATSAGVTSTGNASTKASAVYPTVGAGISYDLNSNVTTDISWSHIQKVGNSRSLGNTDFLGLGVSYAIN